MTEYIHNDGKGGVITMDSRLVSSGVIFAIMYPLRKQLLWWQCLFFYNVFLLKYIPFSTLFCP